LGRVAPIKDIETLIKAFSIVKKQYPEVELDFVGPAEKEYLGKIEGLIKKLNVKLNFIGPIYNLGKKIKIIDLADIFVLPSKREAMPQALIEAMARKKLVISSKTDGGKEIIEDGKTGLLFDIGNEIQFADKILFVLNQKNSKKIDKIKKNAFEHIKQFSWSEIIKKINGVIDEVIE
jgi:GalNAc-alpha-(1->4)-GalNAc-alpha-(1->3)-diNAcBac-PP-undecaprenol alpha-1,4-N-acetyl-D-galactosaminyltransferase